MTRSPLITAWASAGTVLTVMLPFVMGLVFWPPHSAHLELRDSAVQQALSASYVVAGMLLCVLIAWEVGFPWASEQRERLYSGQR